MRTSRAKSNLAKPISRVSGRLGSSRPAMVESPRPEAWSVHYHGLPPARAPITASNWGIAHRHLTG